MKPRPPLHFLSSRLKKTWPDGSWLFYLAPVLLFIALRAPLLHFPPFGDEDFFIRDVTLLGASNLAGYPILSILILKAGSFFLNWSNLRWVPLLFSLALLALTALLAHEWAGKRCAFWAACLLALSPLSVSISDQLLDAAYTAFFLVLTLYFFRRLAENGPRRGLLSIACGISLGCLCLCSYAGVALISGAALYLLLDKGLKKAIVIFAPAALVAAAVFSLYPILLPSHFHNSTLKLGFLDRFRLTIASFPDRPWLYLSSWVKAVVLTGPLLLFGIARTLGNPGRRKTLGLALFVCLTYMGLLLLLINPDRTMGYWYPITPLFCILAAQWIADSLGRCKPALLLLLIAGYWAVLAALTAIGPHAVMAVHPVHWSRRLIFEFFPVRIFYGPSLCFYGRPLAVIFGFLGLAALWALSRRFPSARRHLAALGLAYGLFFSMEYARPLFSPDLNRAGRHLLASLEEHPAPEPIYLHGYGALQCEMHHIKVQPFMYDENLIKSLLPVMAETGGSVVLADSPAIGERSALRVFLHRNAALTRSFSDDGVVLAEVWKLKRPKK